MTANVLVIYHSRKGTLRALAMAAAHGASAAGATVRLLRLPDGDVPSDPGDVPPTKDDLLWSDGIIWGSPTFYGNISAPVKRFIDSTSDLWRAGLLADRVVIGMTSSTSLNGGQEATLLGLYRSMYHWGAVVMSADSNWPRWAESGANPYGVSVCASGGLLADVSREAAHHTGFRVTQLAQRIRPPRSSLDVDHTAARIVVVCQDGQPALRNMAEAVAAGARETQASVRVRRIVPLATPNANGDPPWSVPIVSPADISWADGLAWGMSATTGLLPATLAHFIETARAALPGGEFLGKTVTAFGTTMNANAGGESMLLSAYTTMHNWDALIVAPGYTDPAVAAAGGNPYGTLFHGHNGPQLSEALASARHQGTRLSLLTGHVRDEVRPTGTAGR